MVNTSEASSSSITALCRTIRRVRVAETTNGEVRAGVEKRLSSLCSMAGELCVLEVLVSNVMAFVNSRVLERDGCGLMSVKACFFVIFVSGVVVWVRGRKWASPSS